MEGLRDPASLRCDAFALRFVSRMRWIFPTLAVKNACVVKPEVVKTTEEEYFGRIAQELAEHPCLYDLTTRYIEHSDGVPLPKDEA